MKKANLIVFISILLIGFIGIASIKITKDKDAIKKTENLISQIKESKDYQLLYVYSDDCEPCEYEQSQIEVLIKNYEFGLYHLNLAGLSNSKISSSLIELGVKAGSFSTPSLIVFKDGKYVDILSGLSHVNEIFDFLQKNSIINEEEELLLNYLNLEEYLNIINSDVPQIIALGSVALLESNVAQLELWDVASENDVKINYFSLSSLTQEEGETFENSLTYFEENNVGIPMLIIVKNNEVIASTLDVLDKEGYIDFLKGNGML